MFMVAVLVKPLASDTLTPNSLVPASALEGVPKMVPSVDNTSQTGPLSLVKVRVSPGFGSEAIVAMEFEYGWPAVAAGWVKGLELKIGAPFTSINSVAVFDKPPESLTLTVKEFVPTSESLGVPEISPLEPTVSQVGPSSLLNVRVSPGFGSVALVATDCR